MNCLITRHNHSNEYVRLKNHLKDLREQIINVAGRDILPEILERENCHSVKFILYD